MPTIDFDAFVGEQDAEPLHLKVGGKVYDLPPAMPASVALHMNRLHLDEGDEAEITGEDALALCQELFGEDLFARVLRESKLPLERLPQLIQVVVEEYTSKMGTANPNRAARRARRSRRLKSGRQ